MADIETSSEEDDYGDLFAHVSQNIFDLARSNKSKLSKHPRILCRRIGFILIHFFNSSFESQERRMGHGKSRPLRNLSKKKGF